MTNKLFSPSVQEKEIVIPRLSLRKNFSWTLAGNLVYAASQWAMLMIIAKLGDPVMVGQFSLGLAVAAPVIIFSELHLRVVQATDIKGEYVFPQYLGLRLITSLLAILVIFGIVWWGEYRQETKIVIGIIGVAKAVEAISDIIYGLMQKYERMDRIATSMMIKGPFSLLALGLGIYFGKSVVWGCLGLLTVWTILLVTYDFYNVSLIARASKESMTANNVIGVSIKNVFSSSQELKKIWRLVWISIPLGLVMMIISLKTNVPRYFIEHYLGERELGLYAAMAYIMVAGKTINNALGQSASPRLATYYANGKADRFRDLLIKLTLIGISLGLAGTLIVFVAGKQILTIIYRAEYAEHVNVFLWIMVSASIGFAGGFLGHGLTAARYFRVQVPINVIGLMIILATSYLLIPTYGLVGAAWAGGIVFLLDLVIKTVVLLYAIKQIR